MRMFARTVLLSVTMLTSSVAVQAADTKPAPFNVYEASIADIQQAIRDRRVTAHQVTQMYLDRIAAFDKGGPKINSVITVNPKALEEADAVDAAFARTGQFVGPLHGVGVLIKDQVDVGGLPTTLGSLSMKDYVPTKDATAVVRVKKAGGIIIAKMTLGEGGGGDTFGSLFGETHNAYDLKRTVGGSSGGPGVGVSANFGTIAVAEEGFASIRRPSAWNSVVGMRPSPGLVPRGGMWDGFPSPVGQLGPMGKTVTDMAKLLDVMVGYDAEDPISALGRGHIPESYTKSLDKDGLKGARIGILRTPQGDQTDPSSDDFKRVSVLFDRAVGELRAAGATTVEIEIPNLNEALATRVGNPADDSASVYFARNPNSQYHSMKDLEADPDYPKSIRVKRAQYMASQRTTQPTGTPESRYAQYVIARDRLAIAIQKIMADNNLDAIVHKTNEHTPTLIKDGIAPPYVNQKGSPHLNTFLIHAASVAVPSGFTDDGLPVGITFFGPSYSEPTLLKLAYSYEQATHHRIPPKTTPALKPKK